MNRLSLSFVVMLLFLRSSASASTIKYDGPWKWNDVSVKSETSIGDNGYPVSVKYTGTIEIAGYKDEVSELEIPKKITWRAEEWGSNILEYGDQILLSEVTYDYDVVAIAAYAFDGNSNARYQKLEQIEIPDTVKKIKAGAFRGCNSLRSITIPDSVTEVGEYCFSGCETLQTISFSSQMTTIPRYCLYNCASLSNVTIPNGIVEIGEYAFQAAGSAPDAQRMNVEIPPSVKVIGNYAFEYMFNVTNLIVQGVQTINREQFFMMTNLVSLTIGQGVQKIEEYFNEGCFINLRYLNCQSDDLRHIGNRAFHSNQYQIIGTIKSQQTGKGCFAGES